MRFDHEQLAQLHAQGYVIFECPFPQTLTERCVEALEKIAVDPYPRTEFEKLVKYRLPRLVEGAVWSALDQSLPFLQINLHPEIVELAQQLLACDDIFYTNGHIVELSLGHSWYWHRDMCTDNVFFMHYFKGVTRSNGCLRVVPGSQDHKASVNVDNELIPRLRSEQQTAQQKTHTANDDLSIRSPVEYVADASLPQEVSLEVGPHQMIARYHSILHATWLNSSEEGRPMNNWWFQRAGDGIRFFDFSKHLSPELISRLTPEQIRSLWLDREFELDPMQAEARARESQAGEVLWSLI